MSQNELLDCIREIFQKCIVNDNSSPIYHQSEISCSYYGIQVDEVTDVSNSEQLGIHGIYLNNGKPIEKILSLLSAVNYRVSYV